MIFMNRTGSPQLLLKQKYFFPSGPGDCHSPTDLQFLEFAQKCQGLFVLYIFFPLFLLFSVFALSKLELLKKMYTKQWKRLWLSFHCQI